jgi:chitin deacetylase
MLLIVLVAFLLFQISKLRTFQFFGGLTARVNTNDKVVALTFDDAPSEYTEDILDILDKENVKATFYAIGENLDKFPEQGKHLVLYDHELGNHSYTHTRFLLKSQSFIDSEIQKTNVAIRKTGYKGEITFRPPNGKKLIGLPWYLHTHNIETIMWDVEPDTYVPSNKKADAKRDFIVSYTLANTKPGSIILIHPFCKEECQADRDALEPIIDGLRAKGYTFVTISELLKYKK